MPRIVGLVEHVEMSADVQMVVVMCECVIGWGGVCDWQGWSV